jgi:hypothetical protein
MEKTSKGRIRSHIFLTEDSAHNECLEGVKHADTYETMVLGGKTEYF